MASDATSNRVFEITEQRLRLTVVLAFIIGMVLGHAL